MKKIKMGSWGMRERKEMHPFLPLFLRPFIGCELFERPPSLTESWEEGWTLPQNPEKAARGAELAAVPVLCNAIRESDCLFWRTGSNTAGVTGFATVLRQKAGKIPQSEILSACGQAGTPNLGSGI